MRDGRTARGSTVTIFYSKGVAEKNQQIKTSHSVRFQRQASERFGHVSYGIRYTKVQGEDSLRFCSVLFQKLQFHRWVHCFQKEFQRGGELGVWRLHLASKFVILLKTRLLKSFPWDALVYGSIMAFYLNLEN